MKHFFSMSILVSAACVAVIAGLLFAWMAISTSSVSAEPEKDTPAAHVPDIVSAAGNEFAFRLFSELARKDADKNVIISAPSVFLALSMVTNGAVGETQTAITEALQAADVSLADLNKGASAMLANLNSPGPGVELSSANSLWASDAVEIEKDFLKTNRDYYNAEVATLDFSDPKSVDAINDWVNNKTKGCIPSIISSIDPMTVMVLVNAVYFKGLWTEPFDKADTEQRDFTLADSSQVNVPMMSAEDSYLYMKGDGFQVISLPYGDERMSMIIILPSRELGINGLLGKLNAQNYSTWMSKLSNKRGKIVLPRLKTSYTTQLSDQLKAMGMGTAFSSSRADFSKMTFSKAWIGDVVHKTTLEVNEEGTEAAAATAVFMAGSAMPQAEETFEMIVDRPYFCTIYDRETRLVLFMGVIMDPR